MNTQLEREMKIMNTQLEREMFGPIYATQRYLAVLGIGFWIGVFACGG